MAMPIGKPANLPMLQKLLGELLDLGESPKSKRKADSSYAKFRKECQRLGLTYKVANDGYIELSNGGFFPHYNWVESLCRLEKGLKTGDYLE
jgi:hypothetical protein